MSQKLIDMDLLNKLQMQFGSANNMYLACLDSDRKVLSSCYRTGGEERFFEERMPKKLIQRLLDSAEHAQLESMIEESLDVPYLKLCVVVNRVGDEVALLWVAAAVIEDYLTSDDVIPEYVLRMTEEQFYRSIGMLETVSKQLFAVSEQAAYASILDNVNCAVYVADYDKKELLYFNEGFRNIVAEHFASDCTEETFFSSKIARLDDGVWELHFEQKNHWLEIHQQRLKWVDGRTVCLGNIFDITEKKLYQQKIEYQVSVDNLTGLYNRMRCEQDLEKYMKEAERTGQEGAFLCINLDDFKNINAALGHSYGDNLLKTIAYNLTRVPGIENDCYRINGDEFAIIVHGREYRSLSRICKDLRTVFERTWFMKDVDFSCTMSMGVACFPTDSNNVDDLTRKVTLALSTAKKKGKNCVEFYNEKIEATSVHRVDLEKSMRRATLNSCNEFDVYYQPIMAYEGKNVVCCGAEALVRWNSGDFGMIMPKDFIPLAEYLGVINPIGEHVLEEAVKRCKYWNDCGHPEYKVHVNVSQIQLLQPDFAMKVKQILHKADLCAGNLVLEVTESLALNDLDRMKQVVQQTKNLGVAVAWDGFGTGYSSLSHIREIPMDIIKVDTSLTQKLGEDPFVESFVKMIGELAQTIGVSVALVGIEKKSQLEYLNDISVKFLQGYYYGEAMPMKLFEKLYL